MSAQSIYDFPRKRNNSLFRFAEANKRLEEELEVYGSGLKTSVQLTSYTFEVCDSVLNIAPIGSMTVGERTNEEEDDIEQLKDSNAKPELEIVTSSGRGKNGALCVLQHSIKPQTITSFSLSGCIDVWTVFDESTPRDLNHAFMVLSQESTTMVLQTADEINEIENTGFCGTQTTIHVGNIGNNRYIVQILSKSMRLLQGTRLLQNIQIDIDSPFVQVSICDPYICAQTANGSVITLALRETRGTPRLAINKNTISSVSQAHRPPFRGPTNNIRFFSVARSHRLERIPRCVRNVHHEIRRLF